MLVLFLLIFKYTLKNKEGKRKKFFGLLCKCVPTNKIPEDQCIAKKVTFCPYQEYDNALLLSYSFF